MHCTRVRAPPARECRSLCFLFGALRPSPPGQRLSTSLTAKEVTPLGFHVALVTRTGQTRGAFLRVSSRQQKKQCFKAYYLLTMCRTKNEWKATMVLVLLLVLLVVVLLCDYHNSAPCGHIAATSSAFSYTIAACSCQGQNLNILTVALAPLTTPTNPSFSSSSPASASTSSVP
jgi:hypothetical protein